MKTLTIFLPIVLLKAAILFSQTNFHPGYIIQESGDSIWGEIDAKGPDLLSRSCVFRTSSTDKARTYWPNQLVGFRLQDGKYYVSKDLNGEKYFFEFLINGTLNIYYLSLESGDSYYLDKEALPLTEIPYEEKIKVKNGQRHLVKSTQHYGVLQYNMKDDPDIESRVSKIRKPEHRNLIKLAKDYHYAVCEDEACIIYQKPVPVIISVEPYMGIGHFPGLDFPRNWINKGGFYEGGVSFFIHLLKNERVAFKTGLGRQFWEHGKDWMQIPLQIHYTIPRPKLQPSAGIGINFYPWGLNNYREDPFFTNQFSLGLKYKIASSLWLSLQANTNTSSFVLSLGRGAGVKIISYGLNLGLHMKITS
ncbi:MAG: hypothetical protein AAF587_25540 [Bacteroidota bacterium]